jgi:Voltage-dependent anion channel
MTRLLRSMRQFAQRLSAWLAGQIETLYPGSFAVMMATGIISNAFFLEGHPILSDALFAANLLAYSLLVIFVVLRLVWFWPALRADLINPRLVFSFFTIVAATDVLGTGIDLRGVESVAQALWFFALLAWFVLIYFSFAVLIFLNTRHGADILEGGWLMAIVGTQSLVILGAAVGATLGHFRPGVFVLIHLLWGLGLTLYGIYIAIFCYRIFRYQAGRCHAVLVGGDGRGRDQHECRFSLGADRQRNFIPAIDAAIRRGRDTPHLGMGYMVDPALGAARNLEACRLSCSADLHADSLEPRVSARYICRGEFASFARGGPSAATVCI